MVDTFWIPRWSSCRAQQCQVHKETRCSHSAIQTFSSTVLRQTKETYFNPNDSTALPFIFLTPVLSKLAPKPLLARALAEISYYSSNEPYRIFWITHRWDYPSTRSRGHMLPSSTTWTADCFSVSTSLGEFQLEEEEHVWSGDIW